MTALDEAPAVASKGMRTHIVLKLQELGIRDDEEQRNVVERWTRGRTRYRHELTPDEADSLARRLRTITPEEIAAVARPTGPAPRVDADPPPPERDRDPAACLSSWDNPDVPSQPEPGGRKCAECPFVAGCTTGGCQHDRHEPAPEPPVDLDELAGRVEAALALDPQTDDVAETTLSVNPEPAPEPTRINPAWPQPAAEGWTGPVMVNGQPNPSGTGRYCLPPPGSCYCGGCLHYVPIPPADSREYREQVRNALRKASEKNEKKRGGRR